MAMAEAPAFSVSNGQGYENVRQLPGSTYVHRLILSRDHKSPRRGCAWRQLRHLTVMYASMVLQDTRICTLMSMQDALCDRN